MSGREGVVPSTSCKWSKQLHQAFVCILFDFHTILFHKLVISQYIVQCFILCSEEEFRQKN